MEEMRRNQEQASSMNLLSSQLGLAEKVRLEGITRRVLTMFDNAIGMSRKEAFDCQVMTLGELIKNYSISVAVAFMALHIGRLSAVLSATRFSDDEITDCAQRVIISRICHEWKLSEIWWFLMNCTSGNYGKWYGGFSCARLMEMMAVYDGERIRENVRIEEKKNKSEKKVVSDGCISRDEYERIKRNFYKHNPTATREDFVTFLKG